MRERSILQSVFALGLRHMAFALLIAIAIAAGLFFWARRLPVKYTASALLSVDGSTSRASIPPQTASAAAEGILRSDQFASLLGRLHPDLTRDPATWRSRISLTHPTPATLRITVAGTDRKAVTVAANAVASLLAAWLPLQPAAPAPVSAPAPAPPVAVAAPPPPAEQPSPARQPDDLAQLRSELASHQAALELQFDRLNRRLNTLAGQQLRLTQGAPATDTASAAKLAAIARQESQLRTGRAHLLRQLEANDSASDVLRAHARAAARHAHRVSPDSTASSALPESSAHDAPPPSTPAAPPSTVEPQPSSTPEPEAANVSFTVVAWASHAQPVADKRKQLIEWSAVAAGLVFGMLYLIFAMRLYRPVAGPATLEELVPAQVIFLGAIPAPPAIPTRSPS